MRVLRSVVGAICKSPILQITPITNLPMLQIAPISSRPHSKFAHVTNCPHSKFAHIPNSPMFSIAPIPNRPSDKKLEKKFFIIKINLYLCPLERSICLVIHTADSTQSLG